MILFKEYCAILEPTMTSPDLLMLIVLLVPGILLSALVMLAFSAGG